MATEHLQVLLQKNHVFAHLTDGILTVLCAEQEVLITDQFYTESENTHSIKEKQYYLYTSHNNTLTSR